MKLLTEDKRYLTVRRILAEWGMNDGGDPHSWRCSYPDRYGPCTCADEIAEDIVSALAKVESD